MHLMQLATTDSLLHVHVKERFRSDFFITRRRDDTLYCTESLVPHARLTLAPVTYMKFHFGALVFSAAFDSLDDFNYRIYYEQMESSK
jgi:hypothetical protein